MYHVLTEYAQYRWLYRIPVHLIALEHVLDRPVSEPGHAVSPFTAATTFPWL